MTTDLEKIWHTITETVSKQAVDIGFKVLGAVVLWIVGGMLIKLALRVTSAAWAARKLDPTVGRYLDNALKALLRLVLILAIFSSFDVETTSLAALMAAAGIAVGTAWSGLLSHYAAGIFLVVLRPFKTGDFVTAGGVTGTVENIGLFVTTIVTMDNVTTLVGNSKVFGETIQNFSVLPTRRVDLTAQLAHDTDHRAAIALLKERLARIPNVATSPAPEVDILTFTLAGPVLAVRPHCHTDHYWQVYFETNFVIREAGFAVPATHQAVLVQQAAG